MTGLTITYAGPPSVTVTLQGEASARVKCSERQAISNESAPGQNAANIQVDLGRQSIECTFSGWRISTADQTLLMTWKRAGYTVTITTDQGSPCNSFTARIHELAFDSGPGRYIMASGKCVEE